MCSLQLLKFSKGRILVRYAHDCSVCVLFFPLQGEYNILLFLHLDSDSESAQTGALGSHGSSARSQ